MFGGLKFFRSLQLYIFLKICPDPNASGSTSHPGTSLLTFLHTPNEVNSPYTQKHVKISSHPNDFVNGKMKL